MVGSAGTTSTGGDDTFSGARVDSVQTWNSGDKIDGGAGNDTLTAVITASVDPATGGVVGVENLVVTSVSTAAQTITFANTSGSTVKIAGVESITNLASAANADLTFANLTTIPVITLNNTAADTAVTFATDVLSGTADSVTLNVIGNTGAVNIAGGGVGIESLVINATSAASTFSAANVGADAKSVVVTGNADLDISAAAAFPKLTTFDSAASTGAIKATFADHASGTTGASTREAVISSGSGKDTIDISGMVVANYKTITVSTGAGDDTIAVAGRLDTKHAIDGGAGNDTLSVTQTDASTLAFAKLVNDNVSNVEVLAFTNATTKVNANNFSDISEFSFATGRTVNLEVLDITSSDTTVFKGGRGANETATGTATAVGTSALTPDALGTKQTAVLKLDGDITGGAAATGATALATGSANGAAGVVGKSAITFGTGVDTLKIIATTADVSITGGKAGNGGNGSPTGAGTGNGGKGGNAAEAIANGSTVSKLTIEGTKDVSILGGAEGVAGSIGKNATGAAASAAAAGAKGDAAVNAFTGEINVDATALTGKLTIGGSSAKDTISVGSGGSDVKSSANGDTITFGAGDDLIVYSSGVHSGAGGSQSNLTLTNTVDVIKSFGSDDAINVDAVAGSITALTTLTSGQLTTVQNAFDAGAGSDLLGAIGALATAIGVSKAAQVQLGGDTYLFVNDSNAGFAEADLLVKIEGLVTLTADNLVF